MATTVFGNNDPNVLVFPDGILDPAGGPPPYVVYAYQGNDTASGSNDSDIVFAGKGNDSVVGNQGSDDLQGGQGNDTLLGGQGSDTLRGGKGNDSLFGGKGTDVLYGGNDADMLDGGEGDDELYGGDGNDTLIAGSGADFLSGEMGNDTFTIAAAGDVEDGDNFAGGQGTDTLTVAAMAGDVSLVGAAISNIENIDIAEGSTLIVTQAEIDSGVVNINGLGYIQSAPGETLDLSGLTELTAGVKDADGMVIQEPVTPEPPSITLTTGTDIKTGNIFNGPLVVDPASPTTATLNPGDQLTGTGTNPTLNATIADPFFGQTGLNPTLKGIETINLLTVQTNTLNAQNTTGLKFLSNDGSNVQTGQVGDLTVSNVANLVDVTVQNQVANTGNDTFIQFADSVVSGADDTINLTLINNGAKANSAGTGQTGTVNLRGTSSGGFETIKVIAQGTNNLTALGSDPSRLANNTGASTALSSASTVKTLNVEGDGSLIVQNQLFNVTKIDATQNKGGVNLLVDQTNPGNVAFTGGLGADRINMGNTLTPLDTLDGLDSDSDTIATTIGNGATNLSVKNFEIYEAANGFIAGGVVDLSLFGGSTIKTMVVKGTNGAVTFNKVMDASKLVLNGEDGLAGNINGNVTVNIDGAGTNTNNTLNIKVGRLAEGGAGTTPLNVGGVTSNSVENVNIESAGASTQNNLGGITDDGLRTLTITGSSNLNTGFVNSGNKLAQVTATAFTGNLTIFTDNGSGGTPPFTGVRVDSGSGADNIATGVNNDILIGNAGADTLTGNAGADTLTGGIGADVFVMNQVALPSDTITDFNVGEGDRFGLFAAAYAGSAAAGTVLTPLTAATAVNANTTIVVDNTTNIAGVNLGTVRFAFDTTTNNLLFDANGDFSAGSVVLATATGAGLTVGNSTNTFLMV